MKFFEFENFRDLLKCHLNLLPKGGHGIKVKIAAELRVHPTLVTQIMNGQKCFSLEQAIALARFLGLNELEKDYFLTLVEYERSGTLELREFFKKRLAKLRKESDKDKIRLSDSLTLTESDQAVYYSHWSYAAIRLFCGLTKKTSPTSLAAALNLPLNFVNRVLAFLVEKGLVVVNKDKSLSRSAHDTYLPSESPLVSRHHMNWRMKAMERHPRLGIGELAYSAPLTLDDRDIPEVRKMCLELIQKLSKKVAASSPESLACINIDWFRVE